MKKNQEYKILYISALVSQKFYTDIHKNNYIFNFAAQKFHQLLSSGLSKINSYNILALSSLFPVFKSVWQYRSTESETGIKYTYLSYFNIPIIKQIMSFLGVLLNVLFFCCKRGQQVIIIDVLLGQLALPAILVAKIFRIKCYGIVTDLPSYMAILGKNKKSIKRLLGNSIFYYTISNYDGYILLTEQMNDVVNPKQRPYMIMEGLVDNTFDCKPIKKYDKRVIFYAGGLFEAFGVKTLIEAFLLLPFDNIELHLYGKGPMENKIQYYSKENSKIKFFGTVPSESIVITEKRATILVNPRSAKHEYTKYSFPSKNMEYLLSGTPMLGMKLPGIPEEYIENMFVFKDDSHICLAKKLEEILMLSNKQLKAKGERAQRFVLENKNNIYQAERVIDFIEKNN